MALSRQNQLGSIQEIEFDFDLIRVDDAAAVIAAVDRLESRSLEAEQSERISGEDPRAFLSRDFSEPGKRWIHCLTDLDRRALNNECFVLKRIIFKMSEN